MFGFGKKNKGKGSGDSPAVEVSTRERLVATRKQVSSSTFNGVSNKYISTVSEQLKHALGTYDGIDEVLARRFGKDSLTYWNFLDGAEGAISAIVRNAKTFLSLAGSVDDKLMADVQKKARQMEVDDNAAIEHWNVVSSMRAEYGPAWEPEDLEAYLEANSHRIASYHDYDFYLNRAIANYDDVPELSSLVDENEELLDRLDQLLAKLAVLEVSLSSEHSGNAKDRLDELLAATEHYDN